MVTGEDTLTVESRFTFDLNRFRLRLTMMTGKVRSRALLLLKCLGVIAAVSLTVTLNRPSRDSVVTKLGPLAYSRLYSSANNTNTTVQEQEGQSKQREAENVSQSLHVNGKKVIFLSPQQQSEERRIDNVSQSIDHIKGKKVVYLRPQEHSELPSGSPTPKEPEKPEWTVSGEQIDIVPNFLETLNGTHHINTSMNLPIIVYNLHQRLVAVTAYSSNHFKEGKDMIASIQKYMPHTKILLYDIGLTAEQRSIASKYCNVEVRTFQWDKYPEHVRKLRTFAWKPLIVQEVSQEYDVIMYGDSSLRVISPHIGQALASLLEFPFLDADPVGLPIVSFTHKGTIDYLNFPPSRQAMASWGTLQAGCWLMLANDVMKQKVIHPWVDCALHPECIAPAGASGSGCRMANLKYRDGRYVGCHRFDQSALNIILAKEFGVQLFTRLGNGSIPSQLWKLHRSPSNEFSIRSCM